MIQLRVVASVDLFRLQTESQLKSKCECDKYFHESWVYVYVHVYSAFDMDGGLQCLVCFVAEIIVKTFEAC